MEINGFTICENKNKETSTYPEGKDYVVYHPIYDGAYMVYEDDNLEDCQNWCMEQDWDNWHEKLR